MFLMGKERDVICGSYLVDKLFIVIIIFCNTYEFQEVSSVFKSKPNMILDSPYRKIYKSTFIQVSTLFNLKDMDINTFGHDGGDHLGFITFEALYAIF